MYRKNSTTFNIMRPGTVSGEWLLPGVDSDDSVFEHVRQIIENAYRTLGALTRDPLIYRYIAAVRGICAAIIRTTAVEYGGCETLRESNAFSLNALLNDVYLDADGTVVDNEAVLMAIFNVFASLADEREEDAFIKRFGAALNMIKSEDRSCAPSLAYKLTVLWNVFALALPSEKALPLVTGL